MKSMNLLGTKRLARLPADVFAKVPNTFAFVWLRRPNGTNVCRKLAHSVTVAALHDDKRRALQRAGHIGRNIQID